MSETRVTAPEIFDQETGRAVLEEVRNHAPKRDTAITIDFADTTKMDSRGGAWLVEIAAYLHKRGATLQCEGQQGQVAKFYELIEPSLDPSQNKIRTRFGFLESLGESGLHVYGEAKEALDLLVDAIYWTVIAPFTGHGFRVSNYLDEVFEMGVRAIIVNFIMNFLLGLTIAMLSAAQVADFGLGIYVADLIVIGFARELAALMTAVVVSARTGAAIAAELATMKVQEEIDALRGMGINIAQYLVAPKLLALITVMPILVSMGVIAGILGGSVWGVYVLDFPRDAWFIQTTNAMQTDDFVQGFVKTLFFAVVIALVGCHNGLRVRGGSRGVGLMTTRAVVMDIFFIVVFDMCFAALFYYILD